MYNVLKSIHTANTSENAQLRSSWFCNLHPTRTLLVLCMWQDISNCFQLVVQCQRRGPHSYPGGLVQGQLLQVGTHLAAAYSLRKHLDIHDIENV